MSDPVIPAPDRLEAAEGEVVQLRQERDETLMLAEGPSTLKDLAAMSFERGLRMVAAEGEVAQLQREMQAARQAYAELVRAKEAAEGEVARLQQECDRIRKHAMEQVKRYDAELSRLRQ